MFTLFGEEVKNVFIELNAEYVEPIQAVKRVIFVDKDKELNTLGLTLFIAENLEVLEQVCELTARQLAEAAAQGAAKH